MASKRILVVDDEPEIVDMLSTALTGQGYLVESAPDAERALDLVRQKIFDAAILDFNLPDMNGVLLHREIRQMDEELAGKTLFTSGLVQSDQNLEYYASYGSGFLPKPFEIPQVLGALDALWDDAAAG